MIFLKDTNKIICTLTNSPININYKLSNIDEDNVVD